MSIWTAVLNVSAVATVAYLYGCWVGLREGRKRGKADAELTFAQWMIV